MTMNHNELREEFKKKFGFADFEERFKPAIEEQIDWWLAHLPSQDTSKSDTKGCCRQCCDLDHDHIQCTDSSRCHCSCHQPSDTIGEVQMSSDGKYVKIGNIIYKETDGDVQNLWQALTNLEKK